MNIIGHIEQAELSMLQAVDALNFACVEVSGLSISEVDRRTLAAQLDDLTARLKEQVSEMKAITQRLGVQVKHLELTA